MIEKIYEETILTIINDADPIFIEDLKKGYFKYLKENYEGDDETKLDYFVNSERNLWKNKTLKERYMHLIYDEYFEKLYDLFMKTFKCVIKKNEAKDKNEKYTCPFSKEELEDINKKAKEYAELVKPFNKENALIGLRDIRNNILYISDLIDELGFKTSVSYHRVN